MKKNHRFQLRVYQKIEPITKHHNVKTLYQPRSTLRSIFRINLQILVHEKNQDNQINKLCT